MSGAWAVTVAVAAFVSASCTSVRTVILLCDLLKALSSWLSWLSGHLTTNPHHDVCSVLAVEAEAETHPNGACTGEPPATHSATILEFFNLLIVCSPSLFVWAIRHHEVNTRKGNTLYDCVSGQG